MRVTLTQTFAALRHPNYRLWFAGQIVSLFGTWMQSAAQGFLIYELTHSPAYLGYIGFATGLPSWMFMLFAGVVADRIERRTLLVITQTSMMILAFILAALAFLDIVQPWHIILMAFLLGVANAYDAPARLALVPELVDREDLTNAIALNGVMFNTAVIIGPTAGSLVYAAFGPGWCFFLNALTFIAVIAGLLLMKLPPFVKPATQNVSAIKRIREGFVYVWASPTILGLIVLVSLLALFGFAFLNLLPAWAVEVLQGDVTTNGLLNSARGVGALLGALSIASLGRFNYRGKILSIGLLIFPVLMIVFSFIRWLPLSLLALAGIGGALVMIMNLANSLVQSNTEDALRGRVSSIYTLTFFGFMPIGSLLLGEVADAIGEPTTLQLAGLALLVSAALIWAFIPRMRRLE